MLTFPSELGVFGVCGEPWAGEAVHVEKSLPQLEAEIAVFRAKVALLEAQNAIIRARIAARAAGLEAAAFFELDSFVMREKLG